MKDRYLKLVQKEFSEWYLDLPTDKDKRLKEFEKFSRAIVTDNSNLCELISRWMTERDKYAEEMARRAKIRWERHLRKIQENKGK